MVCLADMAKAWGVVERAQISFFFFNVYLFLRETEREREGRREGGAERERETQNLKQAPGSELSAESLMRGLNPRTVDHDLSQSWTLNHLRHPGAPGLASLELDNNRPSGL